MNENIIDLSNILKISNTDVMRVFNYCKNLVKMLDKEIEDLTFENTKEFMENIENKREYVSSNYDKNYSYVDYSIDTLESNIRFI
ncbi:hypothetical protein [Clostridium thermobutyricum]|uniref:hypothetical protein n=1 Tax=Clostridium thermobutyricum TaxID=29372 RepID=UPI002942830C|nr:hypothetical protein [Clostridium thermobutyricum]